MLLTSSEIKSQLLDSEVRDVRPVPPDQRAHYVELGTAVKRMTSSKGWKIVEAWLLRKLDVGSILNTPIDKLAITQAKAQAFAEVIQQVNYWIKLAQQFEEEDKSNTKE